jgi:acyl-CoA reductase-like NAD-dependent aldehyde dehydrogenase
MVRPLLIGGEWVPSRDIRPVYAPYDGEILGEVAYAQEEHIERVIALQGTAQAAAARLSTGERYLILDKLAQRLAAEKETIARLIAREAAKPIRYARVEVERGLITITTGRDLVRTLTGEVLPADLNEALQGRLALVQRKPAGPLLAITPFNFPLNLVLHKVIPAVVAGCAITLKPAPQAPLTAFWVAEALLEAGWPPQALTVLLADPPLAEKLVRSPAFRVFSFTGSAAVGWHLQILAARKKTLLELGGSAAVIVHDPPNLESAARAIAEAAYLYSGQTCISVQRIFVQRKLYADFVAAYQAAVQQLKGGNPLEENVYYSSLIDEKAYKRVESWLTEARLGGAQDLLPATIVPEKRLVTPVLLTDVPSESALAREEAFAPYAEIQLYDTIDEAITRVNASPYGLHAGIYTQSESILKKAWEELEVGGVVHNAPPTLRLDHLPYGGVKASGLGREGVKYAVMEYTEPKVLLW